MTNKLLIQFCNFFEGDFYNNAKLLNDKKQLLKRFESYRKDNGYTTKHKRCLSCGKQLRLTMNCSSYDSGLCDNCNVYNL